MFGGAEQSRVPFKQKHTTTVQVKLCGKLTDAFVDLRCITEPQVLDCIGVHGEGVGMLVHVVCVDVVCVHTATN